MSDVALALLSGLGGGIFTLVTTLIVTYRSERAQRISELRQARREIELEALDRAFIVVREFRKIYYTESDDGDPEKTDFLRAQQVEVMSLEHDRLELLSVRVEALASRKLGQLLRRLISHMVETVAAHVHTDITPQELETRVTTLEGLMEEITTHVRKDLGTSEFERRMR